MTASDSRAAALLADGPRTRPPSVRPAVRELVDRIEDEHSTWESRHVHRNNCSLCGASRPGCMRVTVLGLHCSDCGVPVTDADLLYAEIGEEDGCNTLRVRCACGEITTFRADPRG